MSDLAAGGKGILVFHGDDLIVDAGIQHLGDKPGADALNLVGAGYAGGKNGGAFRLDGNYLDGRILRFQVLSDAGNGAAGAHACHKVIHMAVGILVDLGAGGCKVGFGIGLIDKLAGDKAAGNLLRQFVRLGDGALHALGAVGQHQLCAVGLHQLAALHAHGIRHNDNDAVAPGRGDGGQPDAGIAGGRLDDDGALFQQALFLGVVDHRLGNAVLNGAGGVKILQLGQELCLQAVFLFDVGQFQQGSFSDELIGGSINVSHCSILLLDVIS